MWNSEPYHAHAASSSRINTHASDPDDAGSHTPAACFYQGGCLLFSGTLTCTDTSPILIVSGNFVGGAFRMPLGISSSTHSHFPSRCQHLSCPLCPHIIPFSIACFLNGLLSDGTHVLPVFFDVIRPGLLPMSLPVHTRLVLSFRKKRSNLRTPSHPSQYTLLGPFRSPCSDRSSDVNFPVRSQRSCPSNLKTSPVIFSSFSSHVGS